jgi:hypothetical protein
LNQRPLSFSVSSWIGGRFRAAAGANAAAAAPPPCFVVWRLCDLRFSALALEPPDPPLADDTLVDFFLCGARFPLLRRFVAATIPGGLADAEPRRARRFGHPDKVWCVAYLRRSERSVRGVSKSKQKNSI